jgi:group II intron reverse transcriptase/maturase
VSGHRPVPRNQAAEPNDAPGVTVVKPRKAHSLTGRITPSLMLKAFKAVKKNRGAAGIDKVSISMFERNLVQNLTKLCKDLKSGAYWPLPLWRRYIPKAPSKLRPLGIPAVRDRVAQEVIRRLIEPYFELYFSDYSFGFRPHRSCHQAIRELLRFWKQGYRIVLDADIQGFFDNIPHSLIMKRVAERIADGNILTIIQRFLASGVMEDGVLRKTSLGTPQGGVISPLLANIVLDVLDKELAKHGYVFVRYADDFLVLAKSTAEIEKALDLVRSVIEEKLQLKLSPEKTKITSFVKGFEFLGFFFSANGASIRTKSVEKLKDKVRKLTIRSHNFSDEVIQDINRVTRGVANYYATDFSTVKTQCFKLDQMIRRRLRCMKKKRISGNDNHRISNQYFERKGLVSLYAMVSHSQ